jgi:hypothetical protein
MLKQWCATQKREAETSATHLLHRLGGQDGLSKLLGRGGEGRRHDGHQVFLKVHTLESTSVVKTWNPQVNVKTCKKFQLDFPVKMVQ